MEKKLMKKAEQPCETVVAYAGTRCYCVCSPVYCRINYGSDASIGSGTSDIQGANQR